MSKHTPGPWTVSGEEISNAKGWFIASTIYTSASRLRSPPATAAQRANTLLLAAAPDLAEALRSARGEIDAYREALIYARTELDDQANADNVRGHIAETLRKTRHVEHEIAAALTKAGL